MTVSKSIPEFFSGQKLLITGASGLMGKVLIWKLLYSCPQVDTIYVLLRPKYGKPVEHRLEEMLKTRVSAIMLCTSMVHRGVPKKLPSTKGSIIGLGWKICGPQLEKLRLSETVFQLKSEK